MLKVKSALLYYISAATCICRRMPLFSDTRTDKRTCMRDERCGKGSCCCIQVHTYARGVGYACGRFSKDDRVKWSIRYHVCQEVYAKMIANERV
jgi:hypothetical protein